MQIKELFSTCCKVFPLNEVQSILCVDNDRILLNYPYPESEGELLCISEYPEGVLFVIERNGELTDIFVPKDSNVVSINQEIPKNSVFTYLQNEKDFKFPQMDSEPFWEAETDDILRRLLVKSPSYWYLMPEMKKQLEITDRHINTDVSASLGVHLKEDSIQGIGVLSVNDDKITIEFLNFKTKIKATSSGIRELFADVRCPVNCKLVHNEKVTEIRASSLDEENTFAIHINSSSVDTGNRPKAVALISIKAKQRAMRLPRSRTFDLKIQQYKSTPKFPKMFKLDVSKLRFTREYWAGSFGQYYTSSTLSTHILKDLVMLRRSCPISEAQRISKNLKEIFKSYPKRYIEDYKS